MGEALLVRSACVRTSILLYNARCEKCSMQGLFAVVAAACVVDWSDKRQNPSAYAFNLTQEIKLQITKTMILIEIEGFVCGPVGCEYHSVCRPQGFTRLAYFSTV